jgi:hypothetical protein
MGIRAVALVGVGTAVLFRSNGVEPNGGVQGQSDATV